MTRPQMLLGGAVLALVLGVFGGIQWYRKATAPVSVIVTRQPTPAPRAATVIGATASAPRTPDTAPAVVPAAPVAAQKPNDGAALIMVHVVGVVRKPGVYSLPPRARLLDAVHAAGGAKAGADLEAVNLASFVQDGEQIRVPALSERRAVRGETLPLGAVRLTRSALPLRPVRSTARYPLAEAVAPAAAPASRAASGAATAKGDALVNINTADAAELATLPGVGPKTAASILAYRQEHGPFQQAEGLLEIRGIGQKKLARMRDRVVVK